MSEAVMDVAALESAVDSSAIETPRDTSAETTTQDVQSAPEKTTTETESKQETKAEGQEGAKEPDSSKSLAKYLKDLADNPDPNARSAAKVLKDSHFSNEAYKKEFSTVGEAREARAFIKELGADLNQARENWTSTKETLANIEETDQLLYQGSPDVIANVVSDLKEEGHLDALPKLTNHFLDALKQEDPEGFTNLHRGLLVDGLYEIGFPAGINALSAALKNGDIDQAKSVVRSIVKWFSDEQNADRDHRALTKAETQKTDAEKKSAEDKYLALSKETAKPIDSVTNVGLGKELMAFLKTPFGKSLTRPELEDLARSIKGDFHGLLEKDKTYKSTVEKFLRTGKRSEAIEFHRSVVSKHAKGIVDKITNTRYPSKLRGTTVAKALAKTVTRTNTTPVFVSERPTDLIRTRIVVNGKAYQPSDLEMMQIARGQGFVKSGPGTYKLVTWRR